MEREISRVLVVGAGIMGAGIAQVAAHAGYQVELVDKSDEALQRACARITDSMARLVMSGRTSADAAIATGARIAFTTQLEVVAARADVVVEAIVEDIAAKQALFAELDRLCAADALLATNTSQFRIGRIAEVCAHKARVIGMHWSNPPPLMPLVEVILHDQTTPATLATTQEFLRVCGKETVICRKDVPGFISNRLATALCMEAVRLLEEGVANPSDVDTVARFMYGHRMGPLATLDLAGLDTALLTSSALAAHYGGDRFNPPQTLANLVAAGLLGRKSGRGFFDYGADS